MLGSKAEELWSQKQFVQVQGPMGEFKAWQRIPDQPFTS